MMAYLLLGEAGPKKNQRICDIRDKILPTADARQLDYEILDAKKITPAVLKERLLALPTSAPHRLVVLQDVQELVEYNQTLLLEFLSSNPDHLVLIMTADSLAEKTGFGKQLRALAQVVDFGQPKSGSVFDMTRALERRQHAEALVCLNGLLSVGQHPLQLIGGMIWFWRQKKGRISDTKFMEGLEALQEADLNIKRSRVPPDYAMEMLVVKLGMLLG
jgi:DNA polymerase III delta subunit